MPRFDETPHAETVAILDFGSQYSHLIARRVRECHVYCELIPHDAPWNQVEALHPVAFILSGGPASVYEEGSPSLPPYVLEGGRPVLGICYGMQLLAQHLGGKVVSTGRREYGLAHLEIKKQAHPLWAGLPSKLEVWMSHGDVVRHLPPGFSVLASTANTPIAAMGDEKRKLYGVQFHPEVVHTPRGKEILRNFLYKICGCQGTWTPAAFIEESLARIRQQVGEGRVLCALSGGVDSAVTALLVHRAIGPRLTAIFVDTGLMRLGEAEQVIETFRNRLGMHLIAVNAAEEFLKALSGVEEPEEKRRIIGELFIRIFEREAEKSGPLDFLAQGTLYPDVIESSAGSRAAACIKTHHNVGGLPPDMRLRLIEPLRYLFKDEVRAVGEKLGLPEEIVWRHPFPGPGLAVRILGEVTSERLEILRRTDAILIAELKASGWYRRVAQAFAVLLPVRSVGVMGDGRTYAHVVAVRAVTSEDFMTADWAHLPEELLGRIANRIVNEVPGVGRVVYDITSKPPATIEWE